MDGEASDRSSSYGASDSEEREVDSDYAFQSAPSSPTLTEHTEPRGIKRQREESSMTDTSGPSAMDVLAMFAMSTTEKADSDVERPPKKALHAETTSRLQAPVEPVASKRKASEFATLGQFRAHSLPVLPSLGSLISAPMGHIVPQQPRFEALSQHHFSERQQAFIAGSAYLSQHLRHQPPPVMMNYGFA